MPLIRRPVAAGMAFNYAPESGTFYLFVRATPQGRVRQVQAWEGVTLDIDDAGLTGIQMQLQPMTAGRYDWLTIADASRITGFPPHLIQEWVTEGVVRSRDASVWAPDLGLF